jgi:hypothetical protein
MTESPKLLSMSAAAQCETFVLYSTVYRALSCHVAPGEFPPRQRCFCRNIGSLLWTKRFSSCRPWYKNLRERTMTLELTMDRLTLNGYPVVTPRPFFSTVLYVVAQFLNGSKRRPTSKTQFEAASLGVPVRHHTIVVVIFRIFRLNSEEASL